MPRKPDILDLMTKEEIVTWLRTDFFCRVNDIMPKKSDVLFRRWKKQSAALLGKWEQHSKNLRAIGLDKRDELARQFNASMDTKERLALATKMEPYEIKLQRWFQEEKKLQAEDKKLDRLYASIDEARQSE